MKPLAIDLFCGLGGWTEGLLAEGYRVVGFDIERHEYGDHKYPAQLVIQDVLTLHGSQFKDAALIVCSPPCQAYSYRAMPWKRAKELPPPDNTLFEACFRIQREACEAAGRHIPLVVENVRGAQKWVGRAAWHFGSFYLWGDIPALMPIPRKLNRQRDDGAKTPAGNCSEPMWKDRPIARLAHPTPDEMEAHGFKNSGFRSDGSGKSFQSESVNRMNEGTKVQMPPGADSLTIGFQQLAKLQAAEGFKSAGMNWSDQTRKGQDFTRIAGSQSQATQNGTKGNGGSWFGPYSERKARWDGNQSLTSSKSKARKAASAMIAKIPFVLACWIARAWKPHE